MKKSIALLAVVALLFAGVTASAAEVAIGGIVKTNAWMTNNATDLDSDNSDSRAVLEALGELDFSAKLSDNVEARIDVMSTALWGQGGGAAVQMGQAYFEAKEFLYQPLTIKFGKQKMTYSLRGDGNAMWLNTGEAGFAGASANPVAFKFRLNYDKLYADIFFAKFIEDGANPNRYASANRTSAAPAAAGLASTTTRADRLNAVPALNQTGVLTVATGLGPSSLGAGSIDQTLIGFNIDYWLSEKNLINFYYAGLIDEAFTAESRGYLVNANTVD